MTPKRKPESDVEAQTDQATSREPDDAYVGRTAPDDVPDEQESGAERRADENRRRRLS